MSLGVHMWPPHWFLVFIGVSHVYSGVKPTPNKSSHHSKFQRYQTLFQISQFFYFQYGCRLSAILNFSLKILLAGGVHRAEMHHRAKFRQNWSMLCRDIAPFRFFKMGAICHLAFLKFECFCPAVSRSMHQQNKFQQNRSRGFSDIAFFVFHGCHLDF